VQLSGGLGRVVEVVEGLGRLGLLGDERVDHVALVILQFAVQHFQFVVECTDFQRHFALWKARHIF